MVPGKNGPWEKWSLRKMVPGKMVHRKNGPRKNCPQEKWFPENWSPWKCPSKIVPCQNNARKFERLFHFYRSIPLHTQKDVWRLPHDPIYAPNRAPKTLKESRKVYCRVLGFHTLITFEHSTHTHTHARARAHTHHDARRSPHDFLFLSFPGTIFPGFLQLGACRIVRWMSNIFLCV